jgi:purine-binding chemotaxis protein CheW
MRALSFIVDGGLYAVDVNLVRRVVRNMAVTPVPAAPDEIIGITSEKGRVVTVFSLPVLLGNKNNKNKTERRGDLIDAIIFKSFSDSDGENQMGLRIDKPGELIDIDDGAIRPPLLATGAEESFCISGFAEAGSVLYRIIDVASVINRYRDKSNIANIANISNGGINNE